jgi:hypothetical protein
VHTIYIGGSDEDTHGILSSKPAKRRDRLYPRVGDGRAGFNPIRNLSSPWLRLKSLDSPDDGGEADEIVDLLHRYTRLPQHFFVRPNAALTAV